ncbi:hypothetical protein EIZ52_25275 [Pandoraea apista]|nr:hypothetical protein EIZ52_25275 [Pandoraea apista]
MKQLGECEHDVFARSHGAHLHTGRHVRIGDFTEQLIYMLSCMCERVLENLLHGGRRSQRDEQRVVPATRRCSDVSAQHGVAHLRDAGRTPALRIREWTCDVMAPGFLFAAQHAQEGELRDFDIGVGMAQHALRVGWHLAKLLREACFDGRHGELALRLGREGFGECALERVAIAALSGEHRAHRRRERRFATGQHQMAWAHRNVGIGGKVEQAILSVVAAAPHANRTHIHEPFREDLCSGRGGARPVEPVFGGDAGQTLRSGRGGRHRDLPQSGCHILRVCRLMRQRDAVRDGKGIRYPVQQGNMHGGYSG